MNQLLNFEIPWLKIPSDIINLLDEKKDLNSKTNVLANILIDEIRIYSAKIPMAASGL